MSLAKSQLRDHVFATVVCLLVAAAIPACAPAATPTPTTTPTPVPTRTLTRTAIPPTRTATPLPPTPTLVLTPSLTWATFSSATYGITLRHPAHWQPISGYDLKWGASDGFFQLSAIGSETAGIDEVTEREAYHKLMPYGSAPTIEALTIDGQTARLILPSPDQRMGELGQTGLIIQLPQPIQIIGNPYNYLILWADPAHVRDIAATIKLHPPGTGPTPVLTPAEVPQTIEAVLFAVAMQFGVRPDAVQLVRWEQVDWPNGCLGVPMRRLCTEAIVPGYRIIVRLAGQEYEYRSDLQGSQFLLASGPAHGIERPALVWEGGDGCHSLLLAADGQAAVGPCDAPLTPGRLLDEMLRPQQWADLLARFAPFQANTPSGQVVFHGQGQEQASAAWQRAIAAWAELVQLEVRSGRSGASWGTALSWHREMPDQPGYCTFLQVETYGAAFASVARCEGGDPQTLGHGWLTDEELAPFDAWHYEKAPVDLPDLLFTGRGT
ncbi:MAG: hypothetical protein JSW37_12860, partial [Anaerolineales bacterium]